jgi:peptide deformylase
VSLSIIQYPHPTLRHVSRPLKRVDAELRQIIAQMFDLMYQHEGVGLAANQVDLPYRLFVMNPEGDPERKELERVYINPVLSGGKGSAVRDEGCLSIPDIRADVTRNATIRIQAFDMAGNEIDETLEDFPARIVQHETDHLDGVLFIDRLSPTQLAELRDELEDFELVHQSRQASGELPDDTLIAQRIRELEAMRT